MKKVILLRVLLIFLILPSIALITYAHPGKTDSIGGHTNHSTGEYHYHHGYSAHDHYDMDGNGVLDCPYEFDDKTDHSSNSGESSKKSYPTNPTHPKPTQSVKAESHPKKESTFYWSIIIAIGLYIFIMFILPYLFSI